MEKEIYLKFRAGGKDIIVERKYGLLSFEALDSEGHPIALDVEEAIECNMYKFNIGSDKCIIAFDKDDICLHIKKENGIERIYYSIEGDDTQLYSLKEIKEQHENKCYEKIDEIKNDLEVLISDLKTVVSKFKLIVINRLIRKLYKDIDNVKSKYMIKLHKCEYIQDIKECNTFAIEEVTRIEREFIDKIYELM